MQKRQVERQWPSASSPQSAALESDKCQSNSDKPAKSLYTVSSSSLPSYYNCIEYTITALLSTSCCSSHFQNIPPAALQTLPRSIIFTTLRTHLIHLFAVRRQEKPHKTHQFYPLKRVFIAPTRATSALPATQPKSGKRADDSTQLRLSATRT